MSTESVMVNVSFGKNFTSQFNDYLIYGSQASIYIGLPQLNKLLNIVSSIQ